MNYYDVFVVARSRHHGFTLVYDRKCLTCNFFRGSKFSFGRQFCQVYICNNRFRGMGYGTAIAYGIILVFSPFPNIAIISYYNEKPLLTKVIVANLFLSFSCSRIIKWHTYVYNLLTCLNLDGSGSYSPGYGFNQLDDVHPPDRKLDLLEHTG